MYDYNQFGKALNILEMFKQGKVIYHLVWRTKKVFWFDIVNKLLYKHQISIVIPNECRIAATNDGRVFCFGGDNK